MALTSSKSGKSSFPHTSAIANICSAPDGGKLPPINAFSLIASGIYLGGSAVGPPSTINEMLQLAADKKIKPWIEKRPLKEANQTVLDMVDGKARYRYVLVNEKHAE